MLCSINCFYSAKIRHNIDTLAFETRSFRIFCGQGAKKTTALSKTNYKNLRVYLYFRRQKPQTLSSRELRYNSRAL